MEGRSARENLEGPTIPRRQLRQLRVQEGELRVRVIGDAGATPKEVAEETWNCPPELVHHAKQALDQSAVVETKQVETVTGGVKLGTYFNLLVRPYHAVSSRDMKEMNHLAVCLDELRAGSWENWWIPLLPGSSPFTPR